MPAQCCSTQQIAPLPPTDAPVAQACWNWVWALALGLVAGGTCLIVAPSIWPEAQVKLTGEPEARVPYPKLSCHRRRAAGAWAECVGCVGSASRCSLRSIHFAFIVGARAAVAPTHWVRTRAYCWQQATHGHDRASASLRQPPGGARGATDACCQRRRLPAATVCQWRGSRRRSGASCWRRHPSSMPLAIRGTAACCDPPGRGSTG